MRAHAAVHATSTLLADVRTESVRFDVGSLAIDADVTLPATAAGVLLVDGSGSSRHSARNQFVAVNLRAQGVGTVLMERRMSTTVELDTVPGASHLFHEPVALQTVSHLAGDWFLTRLVEHAGAPARDPDAWRTPHEKA